MLYIGAKRRKTFIFSVLPRLTFLTGNPARRCAVSLAATLALLRGLGGLSFTWQLFNFNFNFDYHLPSNCIERTYQIALSLVWTNSAFLRGCFSKKYCNFENKVFRKSFYLLSIYKVIQKTMKQLSVPSLIWTNHTLLSGYF